MKRTGRAVTILTAVGTLTTLVTGTVVTEAGQGTTTRQGTPPTISAGGRTDWGSHNLDPVSYTHLTLPTILLV